MACLRRVSQDPIIQKKDQQIALLEDEVVALKERLAWFERQLFGQKRERFIPSDPAQLEMDLGAAEGQAPAPAVEQISYQRQKKKPRPKPTGRQSWRCFRDRAGLVPTRGIPLHYDVEEYQEYLRMVDELMTKA